MRRGGFFAELLRGAKLEKRPSRCLESASTRRRSERTHKYITLIYDLDRSTVEAISDGNDTEAGNACFSQLSEEQLDSVEAIAMDMSEVDPSFRTTE